MFPCRQFLVRTEERTLLEKSRIAPLLLLLSGDQSLLALMHKTVEPPWTMRVSNAGTHDGLELFAMPGVRVVIFDEQTVEESERGRLLSQIRKQIPTASLLYIASAQSEANERRARTSGAHYYVSKPLSYDNFGYVLQSFLKSRELH